MNSNHLIAAFNQAINWNAFLYIIYKILSTGLSFVLFYHLSVQDFSAWANINSITFLLLLWLDFGLRKSIPRYAPVFSKNSHAIKKFTLYIISFQISLLVAAVPLFLYLASKLTSHLNLTDYIFYCYLGSAVFLTEGLISVIRLIYHAHFWQKQFNSLASVVLITQMFTNMFLIATLTKEKILTSIMTTHIIAGSIINLIALVWLTKLYRTHIKESETIDFNKTLKAFVQHSGLMWINNNIKSLSERNTLMPFFTYPVGPELANIFKLANDASLLFYRIVLKTIGSSDTALLTYAQISDQKERLMPVAFKKLATTIAALCLPLLGILGIVFIKRNIFFNNQFVFQAFFIMVLGYLLELVLSPYERVLEVRRRYALLILSYVPYIVVMFSIFLFNAPAQLGLLKVIILIQGVRLVSSCTMVYYARRYCPQDIFVPSDLSVEAQRAKSDE